MRERDKQDLSVFQLHHELFFAAIRHRPDDHPKHLSQYVIYRVAKKRDTALRREQAKSHRGLVVETRHQRTGKPFETVAAKIQIDNFFRLRLVESLDTPRGILAVDIDPILQSDSVLAQQLGILGTFLRMSEIHLAGKRDKERAAYRAFTDEGNVRTHRTMNRKRLLRKDLVSSNRSTLLAIEHPVQNPVRPDSEHC